jgi:8-oxo-dGTP pyrophosphatase MutT (NUDIX family)
VFANPWLRLREDEIEYPDGSSGVYTVVEKQDFALVVPYANGGFWIVQQFRYPVGRREWEFPQGGWAHGCTGSSEELAVTELAEETGLRAGTFDQLGRLYASYGFCSQSFDVWLASDLTEGNPDREHTVADMVHEFVTEARLREMVHTGDFRDSNSVAALALFDQPRPCPPRA